MIQIEKGGNLERTKDFFDDLFSRGVDCDVLGLSDGHGAGVFWREPAVPPGRRGGGGLRNRGMFDDEGNALPVIHVFDRYTRW